MRIELGGRSDLLDDTVLEDRHTITEGHGLDLIVGDINHGGAETALQGRDLRTCLHAQLGVQVAQRLIHEEDLRLAHDGPAHGDALALAT